MLGMMARMEDEPGHAALGVVLWLAQKAVELAAQPGGIFDIKLDAVCLAATI